MVCPNEVNIGEGQHFYFVLANILPFFFLLTGDCYACKNQRMDDLKHPMIGAFDRGSPDTVFPFIYGSDSSDDEDGPVCFI